MGHYLYERFWYSVPRRGSRLQMVNHRDPMFRSLLPMDAHWCKREVVVGTTTSLFTPSGEQHQGRARLHHAEGWTIIAWWDRSGDRRYGSNAAFFLRGVHSFEQALSLAREVFPDELSRMESAYNIELQP